MAWRAYREAGQLGSPPGRKTGKRIGLAPLRRLKAQNASLRPFKSKPNVFHWDDKKASHVLLVASDWE
jgi:hypothetical protein